MFNLAQIVAATPAKPLEPSEAVTDKMLRRYARTDPAGNILRLTDAEMAEFVMVFPDICAELLVLRRHIRQIDAMGDPDPVERAESIAQGVADELAEVLARLSELEASVSELSAQGRAQC